MSAFDSSDRASRARAIAPRYSPCWVPLVKAEGILAQPVRRGIWYSTLCLC